MESGTTLPVTASLGVTGPSWDIVFTDAEPPAPVEPAPVDPEPSPPTRIPADVELPATGTTLTGQLQLAAGLFMFGILLVLSRRRQQVQPRQPIS